MPIIGSESSKEQEQILKRPYSLSSCNVGANPTSDRFNYKQQKEIDMKRLTLATLGALAVMMSCQALATIDILPGEHKSVLYITANTHFNAWCWLTTVAGDPVVFSIKVTGTLESGSGDFGGLFRIPSARTRDDSSVSLNFNGVTGSSYGDLTLTNMTIPVLGKTGILTVECDYTNHAK